MNAGRKVLDIHRGAGGTFSGHKPSGDNTRRLISASPSGAWE